MDRKLQRLSFEDEIQRLNELSAGRRAEFIEAVLFGGYFSDFPEPLQQRGCPFEFVIMDLRHNSSNGPIGMYLLQAAEYGGSGVKAIGRWWTETAAFRDFVQKNGEEKAKIRLKEIETIARVAMDRAEKSKGAPSSWWEHAKFYFRR